MKELDNKNVSTSTISNPESLPKYESPRLTLMDEDQVMTAFQVPVVAASWWVM